MALKKGLRAQHRGIATLVALTAALLGSVLPVEWSGGASADDAKRAIDASVDEDQIQRDAPLANGAETSPDRTRKSLSQSDPDIQREPPERQDDVPQLPAPAAPLDLSWLPFTILAVIGAALLGLLARYVTSRFGLNKVETDRPAEKATTISYALEAREPERDHIFDEVDALAEEGAFAEAIHRLLLLVQERLRGKIEHGVQASLTSREILHRANLPHEAASAFAGLVAAVEITLFGRQSADLATYRQCRENSQRILSAA